MNEIFDIGQKITSDDFLLFTIRASLSFEKISRIYFLRISLIDRIDHANQLQYAFADSDPFDMKRSIDQYVEMILDHVMRKLISSITPFDYGALLQNDSFSKFCNDLTDKLKKSLQDDIA